MIGTEFRVCFKDTPIAFFVTYNSARAYVYDVFNIHMPRDDWSFYTEDDINEDNGPSVEIHDLTD